MAMNEPKASGDKRLAEMIAAASVKRTVGEVVVEG